MRLSAPLRFPLIVVAGWIGVRAAMLGLPGSEAREAKQAILPSVSPARPPFRSQSAGDPSRNLPLEHAPYPSDVLVAQRAFHIWLSELSSSLPPIHTDVTPIASSPATEVVTPPKMLPSATPFPPAVERRNRANRWGADIWLFLRENGKELLPSPVLGGSQIGGRLTYRLSGATARPLRASLRFYAPASSLRAGEVAAGVEWRPAANVPVQLLAERRQALGESGRSAFSLTAFGGTSRKVAGGQADIYAQAGIVGLRERDLFADGIATLRWRLTPGDRIRAGLGAWGAAQPGASRLDIGPTIAFRPLADAPVTLSLDWRRRITGNAASASGPALTLSAGF